MDFTNINDPTAVKALLEQLRESQAWQDTIASTPKQTSVASLLSQLQPNSQGAPLHSASPSPCANSAAGSPSSSQTHANANNTPLLPPPRLHPSGAPSKQELLSCSFQQALPHLARLSSSPQFVSAVSEMTRQQADLERQLWEERRAIQQKHESKVKVAVTKARLIGSEGLSQYEADLMTQAFKKEILKFDMDRVLPAWDCLMSKHQAALEVLGCPAMYVTNMTADLQRQKRVIQVLESIVAGQGN